jgi:hypothetical protein
MVRTLRWSAVVALLGVYVALAVTAVTRKSNTFDEIAHVTAGYAYWAFDDYRLQPENGNWPQRLAAIPAFVGGAAFASTESPWWRHSDVWTVGDEFFFHRGNDINRWLLFGRTTIALIGAALGALVFAWTRRIAGDRPAWVALTLFVASPTMLAHGALATSDMAAALGFLGSVGALWALLHRITPLRLIVSALACSALFLAKFSAVLILPMAALLVGVRWLRGGSLIWRSTRRGRWAVIRGAVPTLAAAGIIVAIHILVAWTLIWASYGFRYSAFAEQRGDNQFLVDWSRVAGPGTHGQNVTPALVEWARAAHALPEAYLYGFSHTMAFSQARPAFMNGDVQSTGRTAFFPFAFVAKTTLPFLGLLTLGFTAGWYAVRARRRWWLYRVSPLLVLITVYWAAALTTNLNIGHRHLIPTYPALMILAGFSLWWTRPTRSAAPWRRLVTPIVALLCAWHMTESWLIRPHYLAYFNQLVGGPARGYTRLVDSSLDWGQDLPGLKVWLDTHRASADEPVYLSYFGTSSPAHFGIHATALPGFLDRRPPSTGEPWKPGLYCISATMLQGVYGLTQGRWTSDDETQYVRLGQIVHELADNPAERGRALNIYEQLQFARLSAYLRLQEPIANVGFSILIYRLSAEELAAALAGPAPPSRPVG